jgi:iron complex outermembrane recepter protein
LLFAKVARGYKTGGINTGAVNPGRESFEPEFVTTYEAGLKSDFTIADKPARFNIGYYHSDYKDIQRAAGDFNTTTNASGAIVINIAEATIDGVELEASIEPIKDLILSGNYSYTDASYDKYDFPILAPQIDCSGGLVFGTAALSCLPFQYTPENQYSVSARYTLPLNPSLGEISGSVTYSYQDDRYSSPSTLLIQEPGALLDSFGLLNLAVTWRNMLNQPVDLRLFMTNATDEVYRTSNSNIFNSIGVQTSIYGEPQMYGMSLRYHWGD